MNYNLLGIIGLVFVGFTYSQKPWEPTPRIEAGWLETHMKFVNNTRVNADKINIVFIGSSSIERWGSTGVDLWTQKYAQFGAVNYGIGSDRTEHVLWRILNGEIDGLNPKMAVVYIGSNNVPLNTNNSEVVRGMTTVIDTFRAKLPKTAVLFLGVFPRGDRSPINETFERILAINDDLHAHSDDNDRVSILNIFWDLASSMGQLKDELYSSDKLHLSKLGYEQWDASMNATFYRLWNSNSTG